MQVLQWRRTVYFLVSPKHCISRFCNKNLFKGMDNNNPMALHRAHQIIIYADWKKYLVAAFHSYVKSLLLLSSCFNRQKKAHSPLWCEKLSLSKSPEQAYLTLQQAYSKRCFPLLAKIYLYKVCLFLDFRMSLTTSRVGWMQPERHFVGQKSIHTLKSHSCKMFLIKFNVM